MRTLALVLAVAACGSGNAAPTPPNPAPKPSKMELAPKAMTLAESGIVAGWIDRGADPCTDFFAFACGNFVKTAQIPPDRSSWGAIQIVQKDNEEFLKRVLEDAAAKPGADPVAQKIGAYYKACMDETAVETAGTRPMRPLLDEIATVKDAATAAHAITALHAEGLSPFFDFGAVQDFADATKVIASLDQAGLGLPDRKFYLENKGTMAKTRATYRAHQQRMFVLLGKTPAEAKVAADNAFRVENALAKLHQDDVLRRDPHAIYHRVDRDGLEKKLAPTFPWADYLTALGVGSVTAITVNDPKYYTAIARLLRDEKPAALRDYLAWTVMRETANLLGHAWVDEAFTMQKQLLGMKELPPRWRRCVHRVDADLGELLGQSYVKAKFAGDSKARAIQLTKSVFAAMAVELDNLPWMDAPTREAAKQKLAKMTYLVGYPDKWRSYDFAVSPTDFAGNVRAATRWEIKRRLAKIGKPVDRFDWQMSPPTVNAYYDLSLNELALPAGQLQPPFFAAGFHPAVNFGSTGGGTIGHEMTHGFDDQGNQFDGDGNLRDWWSKATKQQFAVATKCIQEQYGKYEAVKGVRLDGKLTSGENIADNGGVKLAYQAYQAWRTQQRPAPQRDVEGFSDDQLYFLGYAQSWCEKVTTEQLETMAHSNPHSPPMWRVNGVIVNQPGFGPAFKCTAGAPMSPGKFCGVW